MGTLNEKALNGLYHSDPDTRAVFIQRASMPRQDETIMDDFESGLAQKGKIIPHRKLVEFFKKLADFGAGEFIVGRKRHPSRFRWEVDSIKIAANYGTHGEHSPTIQHPNRPEAGRAIDSAPTKLLKHHYALRPELIITFQLPADLNSAEVVRLCQFLTSLPFC